MNLSFWSLLALVFTMFVFSSKTLIGYDLSVLSDTACGLVMFSKRFVRQIPCWVDVLITVDRYHLIIYNHKIKSVSERKNLCFILLAIIVLLSFVDETNLYYQLFYTYTQTRNGTSVNESNQSVPIVTSIACTSTKSNMLTSDLLAAIFRSILPSLIMVVLSYFLVKKIREKSRKMSKINVSSSKSRTDRNKTISKEMSFNVCIVSMNIQFIILNFPYSITNVTKTICLNYIQIQDPLTVSILKSLNTIAFDLASLYYSSMFFSFIFFNKLFLKEILIIFGIEKVPNRQVSNSSRK